MPIIETGAGTALGGCSLAAGGGCSLAAWATWAGNGSAARLPEPARSAAHTGPTPM